MARPYLLLQLTDLHLGGPAEVVDPAESLQRAVAAVRALPDRPDALLVSGDLTEHGAPEEYALAAELLAPLGLEPHVLPGNHDERGALRRAFGLAGEGAEPIRWAADLGPLRLVGLDTVLPGEDRGALGAAALEWLDATLAAAPAAPTILAMHHPPLVTQLPAFDEICFTAPEREGLAAVLGRHPQVVRVIAGHVHRTIVAELAGRAVVTVPSTHRQPVLDFAGEGFALDRDPPAFAIHAWDGERLTSHQQPVSPLPSEGEAGDRAGA